MGRWLLFMSLLALSAIFFFEKGPDRPPDSESVFRMNLSSEPPTLDWSLATDNVSIRVIENLMEGLAEYDSNLRPRPALAERWEVSPDGLRYLFHLRKDVYWTDGRRVTAADFEYAWKRLLDPKTASEYAYFLYDIQNAAEYNGGGIQDRDKVGVKAVDDDTLQVDLKKPAVYFPSIVTFTATFPQRRDLIEKYGERWTDPERLVTCGPFRLKEWRHEYKLVLTANDRYYGGRPPLDRIIFYIVEEETTALTLYETGDLDRVALPPVAIPHYRTRPDYLHAPFLRGYYYGFNVEKPPFNDVRVRRAFSMAVDRSEIPRVLKGGEIPATSWVPEGMLGHNPKIGLGFDPKRARGLLAEAGYPGGKGLPPITLAFNTDPTNRLIAEQIQAQWKRNLGAEVALDNMEWKVYLKRLKDDTPQIFRLGWGADYPDPDNFLNLFTGAGGNNNTHWKNGAYDRLISEAASEPDESRRVSLYDEAQRILTEQDVPIMPLFFAAQNLLVQPTVQGLEINAMDLLYLKKVRKASKG
ncbi:MAG TPA: peptide ABC transporter substrate-binding protein, partial [Candidatus Manganitrophaceae bacterium]|nr:peptide ABC transporter substrate-binding protein [Candidatus Manganitrophaceae bacterium]